MKENEEKQALEKRGSEPIGVARSLKSENLRSYNEIHNSARDIENVGDLKNRLAKNDKAKETTNTEQTKELNPPPRYGSSIAKAKKMLDDKTEGYTRAKAGTPHNSIVNSIVPVGKQQPVNMARNNTNESEKKLLASHNSINNSSRGLKEEDVVKAKELDKKPPQNNNINAKDLSDEERKKKVNTQDSQNLDNFDLGSDEKDKGVDSSTKDKQKDDDNFNSIAKYVKEQAKNKKDRNASPAPREKKSEMDLIKADIERQKHRDTSSNASLDFIR